MVDQAGIVDGSRVLDLACGTGVAAMIVKQRYPRCAVTGLDVDARILEAARRRMTKAEVSGVALVCAPAERTGLDAASFDTVISTLAFHHLPPRSKQKAAGEVARLLRAGGTFLLMDIQPRARSVPTMTEEQAVSPKWASRSNTADNLYQVFSRAGLHAHAEDPPRTWVFRPWLFALRATKPADWPARARTYNLRLRRNALVASRASIADKSPSPIVRSVLWSPGSICPRIAARGVAQGPP